MNDQINEANYMINNINKEMDIVKKGYNIDDASEEQADYKLLLKEKNSLSNSDITLSDEEQELLLDTIESEQATPSLSQALRMKKLSQEHALNEDTMLAIMCEQKKPAKVDVTLSGDKLRKNFPKSYSPMQMEAVIFKLLEAWQKKRQRDQAR